MTAEEFTEWVRGMSVDEKEQLTEKIEQSAYEYEKTNYGCARCVLKALMQHLNLGNLEDGQLMKATFPLAGGVAYSGGVCGALLGGMMAIGLAYGSNKFESSEYDPSSPDDEAVKRATKLGDKFKEEFGGIMCSDVQRYIHGRVWNLKNPEEGADFYRVHDKCADAAKMAARLAADVIFFMKAPKLG